MSDVIMLLDLASVVLLAGFVDCGLWSGALWDVMWGSVW